MTDGAVSQRIFLNPGTLVIAEEPVIVTTVLGSCVSLTLFNPRLKIGAICHAVLPSGNPDEPSKFVDGSLRYMMDYFRQHKVAPREIVTKLFGGADMFTLIDPRETERTIGAQNIRQARESLRIAGLSLAASDVGGQQGRKLIFYSQSGEVFLKRVKSDQLKTQEQRVARLGRGFC